MDHFPLLALPRELRDWIYDCTLNALEICVQAVELTTPSGDDPEDCPTDRDDGVALSNYTRSIFKPTTDGRQRTFTYGSSRAAQEDNDSINIFLANRQIYEEASSAYYSKNAFYFVGVSADEAMPVQEAFATRVALAFLCDRPEMSLRKINHIGLSIESCEHIQLGAALDGTTMVALCHLISQSMQLKHLDLEFSGTPPDVRGTPWNWDTMDPDGNDQTRPRKWLGALLTIKNLTKLDVAVEYYAEDPENEDGAQEIAFVRFLRSRLLRNGQRLGKDNIALYFRHGITWLWNEEHQCFASSRNRARIISVECADDEYGNSRLEPAERRGPRVCRREAESSTTKDQHGHEIDPIEDGWSDEVEVDWDGSDGGSNDSLIDFQDRISSLQTVPVDDQEYFNLFERDALEV